MKYRVIIQPTAFDDLDETYVYLAKRYSPESAGAWHNGCVEAMQTLADQPERHSTARESAKLGVEIRQLLYRRHHSVYRILSLSNSPQFEWFACDMRREMRSGPRTFPQARIS
jgi:plasmid stabilization system protein ParE